MKQRTNERTNFYSFDLTKKVVMSFVLAMHCTFTHSVKAWKIIEQLRKEREKERKKEREREREKEREKERATFFGDLNARRRIEELKKRGRRVFVFSIEN